MKAFIISSALLALVAADTCSDCTAVVFTIAARLSSEESIASQTVCSKQSSVEEHVHIVGLICRPFWWVDSAQALKTQLNAKLPSRDCGLASLPSSGQATGTPL